MCKFTDALKEHRDGAILDLFVTLGADVILFPAGYNRWRRRIEMKVCSPTKNNKANKEVIKAVADFFDKSNNEVSVISGDKSRAKTLLIQGISVDNITKKLQEVLNES